LEKQNSSSFQIGTKYTLVVIVVVLIVVKMFNRWNRWLPGQLITRWTDGGPKRR